MDGQQFDQLTQHFGDALNRRRFGRLAVVVGLVAGREAANQAEAKPKKKKKPKPCSRGAIRCGRKCVNALTDAGNCGKCGRACPSGQACVGGSCQAGGCPNNQISCGDVCVDPTSDEQHCGSCTTVCTGDLTCLNGQCGCAAGTKCGNSCVDPTSDEQHCGSCGNACQGDLTCIGSQCGCASGTKCGNQCVNTQSSPNHCGDCGHACAAGQTCTGGQCVDIPECTSQAECGGYSYNDLVCRNGRCVCATEGHGICERFSDGRGSCHQCCPGGSGACRFDEVCFYNQLPSGQHYGLCDCPTGWQRCNYQPHPSGTCVEDARFDSHKCGPFCEDCLGNTTFPAICCNGTCFRGCGGPGTSGCSRGQVCGPNCLPCNSDSICCNMGPGTLPRCIPDIHGGTCYLNGV